MRATPIDRVLSRVEMIPEAGCWIFMGALNEAGYGIVGNGGRGTGVDRAHRITYRHFKGETPKGMYVCHRCDVPACCNPDHLFLGTSKDNHQDMRRKRRHSDPPRNHHDCGEYRYNAKMTTEMVIEARKRFDSGEQFSLIAKDMPVSSSVLREIVNRQRWRHIP